MASWLLIIDNRSLIIRLDRNLSKIISLPGGESGGCAPCPPPAGGVRAVGDGIEAAALITHTTTGAVVTDGPPLTPAASFEGTAHEHDIAFLIRRVVLDVRMQPAPSGDVSCRIPMTPELSDPGPVGFEGAPAVRQATNLSIQSSSDNPGSIVPAYRLEG